MRSMCSLQKMPVIITAFKESCHKLEITEEQEGRSLVTVEAVHLTAVTIIPLRTHDPLQSSRSVPNGSPSLL